MPFRNETRSRSGRAILSSAIHSPGSAAQELRPIADFVIAATALANTLTVVTRNAADYEPLGVRVRNPWAYAPEAPLPVY